jgi:hypothetical protein
MNNKINKLFFFYIITFVFFVMIYILVAFVNLEPTQINTQNSIFKKLQYYNSQRWVFFTKDVNKDELFLYDVHFNRINISLSSKKNMYGLKRKSIAIARYLLEFSRETSIYKWQDFNYPLKTKPLISTKDTTRLKYKPNTLEKGVYILEKRPVIPYEWKNDATLIIHSKYILIKVD